MITICPKCALTLSVSAADLRTAQGQVRCGRCLAVFNALLALYDDLPTRKTSGVAAPAQTATNPESPPEPLTAPHPAVTAPAPAIQAAPNAEPRAQPLPLAEMTDAAAQQAETHAATQTEDPTPTDVQATAAAESVQLPPVANDALVDELPAANDPFITEAPASANDPLIEDLAISEPRVMIPDREAAAAAIDLGEPDAATEPLFMRAEVAAELPTDEVSPADESTDAEQAETVEPDDRRARRTGTRGWALGSLLMLLLLLAQWVHANREDLATRASIGTPLRGLYQKLGAPIAPRWDVNAYDVRQQGAVGTADAAAALTVRASIQNRGLRAQPLPLLRVTLQDRFGNRVALRDLQPREYLPAAQAGRWLATGQRVDAAVALADPGGKAVGFEIDACLQLVPGRYICANEHSAATR